MITRQQTRLDNEWDRSGYAELGIGFRHEPIEPKSINWHLILVFLGWLVVLAVIFGACRMVYSETLPEAPRPQRVTDRTEWSLLAVDAGVRVLDVYSTHQMITRGNHEVFLPDAIAHHTPVMAAYSAGAIALNWWVARRLERSHRARLAHFVTLLDIGQDAPLAIHNLCLPQHSRGLELQRFGR